MTVRGDHELDLSGDDDVVDVKVSNIGAGRATFTVDGNTVTLQAGERKQIGRS